jgi:hypothetical protein
VAAWLAPCTAEEDQKIWIVDTTIRPSSVLLPLIHFFYSLVYRQALDEFVSHYELLILATSSEEDLTVRKILEQILTRTPVRFDTISRSWNRIHARDILTEGRFDTSKQQEHHHDE